MTRIDEFETYVYVYRCDGCKAEEQTESSRAPDGWERTPDKQHYCPVCREARKVAADAVVIQEATS